MKIQTSRNICHRTQQLWDFVLPRCADIIALCLVWIKLSYSNTATGPVSRVSFSIISSPHQAAVVKMGLMLFFRRPQKCPHPVLMNNLGRRTLKKSHLHFNVQCWWCCADVLVQHAYLPHGLLLPCPEL